MCEEGEEVCNLLIGERDIITRPGIDSSGKDGASEASVCGLAGDAIGCGDIGREVFEETFFVDGDTGLALASWDIIRDHLYETADNGLHRLEVVLDLGDFRRLTDVLNNDANIRFHAEEYGIRPASCQAFFQSSSLVVSEEDGGCGPGQESIRHEAREAVWALCHLPYVKTLLFAPLRVEHDGFGTCRALNGDEPVFAAACRRLLGFRPYAFGLGALHPKRK